MDQTNNTEKMPLPDRPHQDSKENFLKRKSKWFTFVTTVIAASILLATGVPVPPGLADAISVAFGV